MATKFKVGDYIEDSMGDRTVITKITDTKVWGFWEINGDKNNKRDFEQFTSNIQGCKLVEEEKECEPCSGYNIGIGFVSGCEVYITNNKKETIMSKITTFAKNLVLSADEKLLRKYGLKNECGEFTDEAEDLVIAKLVKENEAYLIELAKGMEAEEAKK